MTAPANVQLLAERGLDGISGIGPATRQKLANIGVHTLQDALFHLPLRYEDRTRLCPLDELMDETTALVEGVVTQVKGLPFARGRMTVMISDDHGELRLQFFHVYPSLRQRLVPGQRLRCFGQVRFFQGNYQMVHPDIQCLFEGKTYPLDGRLTPIYPTVTGLHQSIWRKLIDHALRSIKQAPACLPELLPPEPLSETSISLARAILTVHRPTPDNHPEGLIAGHHPAIARLAYEELLAHRLSLRMSRESYRQITRSPALTLSKSDEQKFLACLPFTLTNAQNRVWQEIAADLTQTVPMLRLLQGDVGSGKTVIAALAAVTAVTQGYQAALMAPTELLAEQHEQLLRHWLAPMGIAVVGLRGSLRTREKTDALAKIDSGEAGLIIGTHALFQQGVHFSHLGVVIVDEQHRFGVAQRLALKNKGHLGGETPHQLIMTATPIPRSLAMIGYADLDSSVIDELPPGRKPITTVVFSNERRDEIIARIKRQCQAGRQVYWVCTLIEENDQLERKSAELLAEELQSKLAPHRVGLIHGRLKPADKEAQMQAFKDQAIDVLVATTVIEVGVDVPNASLMVIENAECFGLAQLHQLRGRVGRGSVESFCVLLYQPPLSALASERLATLHRTQDGFVIARKDLELRGPGDVLGTRQTGEVTFKIADLGRDQVMIERVMTKADTLLATSPDIALTLIQRWIGQRSQYAEV